MASYRFKFRLTVCGFLLVISAILYQVVQFAIEDEDTRSVEKKVLKLKSKVPPPPSASSFRPDIQVPIILWWTPFTRDPGSFKTCGDVSCFMTNDRKFAEHPMMKVFLFYGTDFKLHDLPLPRQSHHEWALLHEESPKNVYLFSHEEIMTLFNHTATFKRESDYPITTQYLSSIEYLESREYLVSTADKNRYQKEGLAPIVYVQSDCGAPSDRDTFVKKLMNYIPIDSYGKCVNNKDLPGHLSDAINGMNHGDFYKLMAKYKFTITIENALCDDYITEKFWRPLHLGSVPIVYAAVSLTDFLPDQSSVVSAREYDTFEELASWLKDLNNNDEKYEAFLKFKEGVKNELLRKTMQSREWKINNDPDHINYIDGFECYICKELHKNLKDNSKALNRHVATNEHYGCPKPKHFFRDELKQVSINPENDQEFWASVWESTRYQAIAFRRYFADGIYEFSEDDLWDYASNLQFASHLPRDETK